MSQNLNFTQALALRRWYNPNPETVELVKELDRDLKKWDAHVSDTSDEEQVCIVVDASYDHVHYRFTFRVHSPVKITGIDTGTMPVPYRGTLRTHMRARNVLKNFLPVVFDRLVADRQFELVSLSGPGHSNASQCIWAANVGTVCLSVVTTVLAEDATRVIDTMDTVPGYLEPVHQMHQMATRQTAALQA